VAVTRKKIDVSTEKQILTGLVVSDHYLRIVAPLYSPDLLEIGFAPIVAGWCLEYFDKYEEAPKQHIQDLFNTWAKTKPDPEQLRFVEDFLATLSDEYEHAEKFNVQYLVDKTTEHFNLRKLENLAEDIKYCTNKGDLAEAKAVMDEYSSIEVETSDWIDPFDDEEAIRSAFDEQATPLFTLPGKIGEIINEHLVRDSFITFIGVAKVGKTWFLKWLAEQAQRARCNVAVFQLGDMSEAAYVRRTHITLAQRSDKKKYCGEIKTPILDCELNQKDTCELHRKRLGTVGCYEDGEKLTYEDAAGYVPCTECQYEPKSPFKGAVWYKIRPACSPLTWREALEQGKAYKKKIRAKGFRLKTYENDSCSISDMRRQLDKWEREDGFVPDVIISDYMDITAPESGQGDERFQENKKWKTGRKLSQNKHVCFISCTQADSLAMGEKSITRKNFTVDRRKWDHVTAAFSFNQTPEEKKEGIMRVGTILVREGEFDEHYQVHVGQCLQIGKPYLFSY